MRGSDRAILLLLPLVAALVAVWILVISPKRAEESELRDEVAGLQAQVDQAEGQVAQAELARREFDDNYAALIDLGAAAPADADQSTLVYSLADIANQNDLHFSGFTLSETPAGAEAATSTATTPPPATGTESGTTTTAESVAGTETTTTTGTTTAPTEAAAATLPLGSAVGPAGFPVSSYAFNLRGKYFNAADFLADVNGLVQASEVQAPKVHGRLLTIDGFSFNLGELQDYPQITANLAVTAYEVPADEGLDAGATPAGPAPAGTTTTGTTTTTTTPPTAAVTP